MGGWAGAWVTMCLRARSARVLWQSRHGRWEMRETGKAGGFGKLAGLREHRENRIKHWLSQSSDTLTNGLRSVSELDTEGGRHRGRQGKEEGGRRGEIQSQKQRGRDRNKRETASQNHSECTKECCISCFFVFFSFSPVFPSCLGSPFFHFIPLFVNIVRK